MIFSLVRDGTLEISVAAQKIQMTVPEFEKALTAAGYKISAEVWYFPAHAGADRDTTSRTTIIGKISFCKNSCSLVSLTHK